MAVNTMTLCGVLLLLLVHGSRLNTSSSVASLRGAQQNGLSHGEPAPGPAKLFHAIRAFLAAAHPDVETAVLEGSVEQASRPKIELSNPTTAAELLRKAMTTAMTSEWDSPPFIPEGQVGHVPCLKEEDLLKQDSEGLLFCLNLESITVQHDTRKYICEGQIYGVHTKAFELEWSFQQRDNVTDRITDLYLHEHEDNRLEPDLRSLQLSIKEEVPLSSFRLTDVLSLGSFDEPW